MAGVAGSELPSQEGKLFFELVGVCQESEKQLGNHLCHKPPFFSLRRAFASASSAFKMAHQRWIASTRARVHSLSDGGLKSACKFASFQRAREPLAEKTAQPVSDGIEAFND